MIAIISMLDGEITGWLFATDPHDARRQMTILNESNFAQWFYSNEFLRPGKYELGLDMFGHRILVLAS